VNTGMTLPGFLQPPLHDIAAVQFASQ